MNGGRFPTYKSMSTGALAPPTTGTPPHGNTWKDRPFHVFHPRFSTTVAPAPAAPYNTTDTTASTSAAFIVLVFLVPRKPLPREHPDPVRRSPGSASAAVHDRLQRTVLDER